MTTRWCMRLSSCPAKATAFGLVVAAACAAQEVEPPTPDDEPVAPGAMMRRVPGERNEAIGGILGIGVRAMFNAIAPGPRQVNEAIPLGEADAGEMPRDPAQAQLWQQRKQVRQQAKHMEQVLQPVLHTELEVIRQTCPGLTPAARREVLEAGRAAVSRTAVEFAMRQLHGGPPRRAADVRQSIRASMSETLEAHASAAEFAAYGREHQARLVRGARAARVAIVAKLDRQLDLSTAQRQAVEDDLERNWEESWLRELDDNGMVINGERAAPDYANECIEPHLDEQQRADWQRWRRAAGTAVVGMNIGWNLDGQGMHELDGWWTGGKQK